MHQPERVYNEVINYSLITNLVNWYFLLITISRRLFQICCTQWGVKKWLNCVLFIISSLMTIKRLLRYTIYLPTKPNERTLWEINIIYLLFFREFTAMVLLACAGLQFLINNSAHSLSRARNCISCERFDIPKQVSETNHATPNTYEIASLQPLFSVRPWRRMV